MSTADAYPFRTLPAPLRFAVALASVGAVFVIDRMFGSVIDDGSHFLLLTTAVMASAWFAGTGPALAATVTGALVGAWQPAVGVNIRATGTHLALFLVQGLLLTALVSELRRARRVAVQQADEAKDARRESESAGRMKDEFLATISHELRTPLNSVLGWLHLLRTGKLDPLTSSRGLEAIERNVRLQARLTGDMLDVSKALTGHLLLESRPVAFVEAVRQAIASATPAAQAKGVQVTSDLPEMSAVPVLGDPARLRQVAWHLLSNAIKFTPSGGAVGLTLEETDGFAVLIVSDSGPGIAPEFLPRIFGRFTQEDPSPTRTAGGLGVGLSLVHDLVELHGGRITASNRIGLNGAVFTARFPLHHDATDVAIPVQPMAFPSSPPLDGLRVLVLDQDADGRELLRTVLQQRGAMVRTAASVADALESLEAWRPDILVSDNITPEHDSYALVGKVHSLDAERGGRIPAAALTAWSRLDQRVRRMLEPVQTDLPKPVEPAVLTAEIARLAGRERRRVARTS
jgi:signal transduction histidine kinase